MYIALISETIFNWAIRLTKKKVTTMPSWLGKEGDLKSVPPHHVCFRLSSEAKAAGAQWANSLLFVQKLLLLKVSLWTPLLRCKYLWALCCRKLSFWTQGKILGPLCSSRLLPVMKLYSFMAKWREKSRACTQWQFLFKIVQKNNCLFCNLNSEKFVLIVSNNFMSDAFSHLKQKINHHLQMEWCFKLNPFK